MIEVQHVTKRYGLLTAVNDVSFRADSGQILGFLGPNGAGKTTTMRILTGCTPATDGKVTVAGFDVFEHAIQAKQRTGYLPETPPLYPDMTVKEYLNFVSRIKGIKSSDRNNRVASVMAQTNIDDVRDRHCGKLSKGYRQRVGIAQAILHNPDVLILDEPTAGLDPKQIIETRELIKSLAGDHTIILSTHILPEVSQTCQRVVIINKGRIVAEDTPENLTGRLRGAVTIRLHINNRLGVDPATTLQRVPGVTHVTTATSNDNVRICDVQSSHGVDLRSELARTIVSNGWELLELTSVRMSLEDIFLQLTTEEDSTEGTINSDKYSTEAKDE